jgi:hypothetical protein
VIVKSRATGQNGTLDVLMPGALKDAATKSGKLFAAAAKKDGEVTHVELRK